MNKTDLSRFVSAKVGLSAGEARVIVELIFETIKEGLAKGEKWEIRGLGTFKVRENAPRVGRIMATGQEVKIPAYKAPVFIPGKILKKIVNK
ncbi:HU family DNA-binding protein [bacterium]|nr:HU family DNA-binding protein [bacterium]MBU2456282.1 HU family DNA-binding protein [Pseudomonadota bacterium]